MVKREIVSIDEDKCDGCGLCIPACHEGAIEIVDGKARLKEEKLCDGLGDCLGECPKDAIKIEVREAEEFNEEAVAREMAEIKGSAGGGCPSARLNSLSRKASPCPAGAGNAAQAAQSSPANQSNSAAPSNPADSEESRTQTAAGSNDINLSIKSQLGQWPVQLALLPETAPIFEGADLLISADCVAHAYADFHLDLLKDKKLVIGCPKLDDSQYYTEKLASIFAKNDINSITVAMMEVPCCGGLKHAVNQALSQVEKDIPVKELVFTVSGEKK